MADSPQLTIVFAYRDRDLARVDRCLSSLAQQTFQDFRVVFVDYGSLAIPPDATRRVAARYPFCTYIRTETQGMPWNKPRALNIAIRQASTPYVMTSDVDMIYVPEFLATLMANAQLHRALYVAHRFLPKGFADWPRLAHYRDRLPVATQAATGTQIIPTPALQAMRGFDEYYRYWGIEDRDLYARLGTLGLETVWLSEQAIMFHQWHPPADIKTPGYIPDGMWGRMENHYYRCREQAARNDATWGRVHTLADRPALGFLDFAQGRLAARDDLTVLRLRVDQPRAIGEMVRAFWELPSGHALALTGAFRPAMSAAANGLIRGLNRGLGWARRAARLGYQANYLHSYLVEMLDENAAQIADFYLNFPAEDGVSLLVKR